MKNYFFTLLLVAVLINIHQSCIAFSYDSSLGIEENQNNQTNSKRNVVKSFDAPPYPELVSPLNNSYIHTITPFLCWKNAAGVVSSDLQISMSPDFSIILFEKKDIEIDSCLITCLDYGTRYYWRVRSKNADGISEYSSAFSFISKYVGPDVVILSSPINGIENIKMPVTLQWEPYLGVVHYYTQVSTDKDFANNMIDTTLAGTICNLTINLKENTTYYWRVGGSWPDGMKDWSRTWVFHSEILDVKKKSEEIPVTYYLSQNYPNPFNPVTTISYSLPEASNVALKVYSSLGEEIETLVNKYQHAGKYQISWKPANLSSGIYFYRITAGAFTLLKKMLYVR